MEAVELLGGRLCGRRIKRKSDPGLYIWTEGRRCYKAPAKGRSLYRRLEPRGKGVLYLFIGDRVGLCSNCGSYTNFEAGKRRCSLCKKDLVRV